MELQSQRNSFDHKENIRLVNSRRRLFLKGTNNKHTVTLVRWNQPLVKISTAMSLQPFSENGLHSYCLSAHVQLQLCVVCTSWQLVTSHFLRTKIFGFLWMLCEMQSSYSCWCIQLHPWHYWQYWRDSAFTCVHYQKSQLSQPFYLLFHIRYKFMAKMSKVKKILRANGSVYHKTFNVKCLL